MNRSHFSIAAVAMVVLLFVLLAIFALTTIASADGTFAQTQDKDPFCDIIWSITPEVGEIVFTVGCFRVPEGIYYLDFGDGQLGQLHIAGTCIAQPERLYHHYKFERDTVSVYTVRLVVPGKNGPIEFSKEITIDTHLPYCSVAVTDGSSYKEKLITITCDTRVNGVVTFGDGAFSEVGFWGSDSPHQFKQQYQEEGIYLVTLFLSWGPSVKSPWAIFVTVDKEEEDDMTEEMEVFVPIVFKGLA